MASSSEQDMEVSDNNTAEQNTEEDGVNNTAPTASMEEDCGNNVPSASEQKIEEDCGNNVPSASEQKIEEDCGNNVPSTSEQKMEEDCGKTGNISEGSGNSGSDTVKHCSLCKRELKSGYQGYARTRISKLVELKTAQVLFPHLSPDEFICKHPCVQWVHSKTRLEKYKKRRTLKPVEEDPLPVAEMRMDHDTTTMPSTSEQKMEEDCGNNMPSTSEQKMEEDTTTMPSTSKQSAERSSSKIFNCSHCKKELKLGPHGYARVKISTLVDLKTAQVLFPHLSPDEFICRAACVNWVNSKTRTGLFKGKSTKNKRTLRAGFADADPERCSNCKVGFTYNENDDYMNRVRISTFIDEVTAKILFPHLQTSDFICMSCAEVVKPKTKFVSNNRRRTWAGSDSSSVDSGPPPSKQDKKKGTVGGGGVTLLPLAPIASVSGVPSLPITPIASVNGVQLLPLAPTSTQNTVGSVRYVVVPKSGLSVAAPKQNQNVVNVLLPCSPNTNIVTVAGSSSMLGMAGSVNKPSQQNIGSSVKAPTTSEQNTEGTVKVPVYDTKGSVHYVVIPRTVLPTSMAGSVNKPSKQNIVSSVKEPSTSEQNTEGTVKVPVVDTRGSVQYVVVPRTVLPTSMAGSVNKPSKQNIVSSVKEVKEPSTSEQNTEGSVKVPVVDTKGSVQYVVVPRTVLPTNWNVKNPAINSDMPSTPEQSAEGSGARAVQRCSLCKKQLIRQRKGWARIRISKLVDLRTAKVLMPHLSPDEFICMDVCWKWVYSKTQKCPNSRHKRTLKTKCPQPAVPRKKIKMDHDSTNTNSAGPSPVPKKVGKRHQAMNRIKNSDYVGAFRRLLELPTAKAAFDKVCQENIRKERIKLVRDMEGPFRKQLTPENLSSFCWKKTNEWIEEKAPFTLTCLRSMFPQPVKMITKSRTVMTEEEAQQLVDKRIGMAMSIALFTGNCKHTFVQSVIGAEMWREGCPLKMFHIMNGLGISLSSPSSRGHIVRLGNDHDKEVKLWKGEVEQAAKIPPRGKLTIRTNRTSLAKRVPAYSLTWDRVKIVSHEKHKRLGGNKPTVFAFRFAHRNRIPFSYLRGPPKKAVEVSPDKILPSKQTYEALRQRMKTIVMRIIVDNLTALEGLRSKVVRHIPHLYSKQMNQKSNVVNLGAVPVDVGLSRKEGNTKIMDGLIEYVPTLSKEPYKQYKVLCCSDGLNVDTTEVEPSESTAEQRFEGLVDAPPEFHKASLCYQDIMKMLLSEESLEARGSLSQLKSVFAVRGLCIEGKIKETLQHVWDMDFMTFVTSAYITLYAATEWNLDTVDQQPSDFPTDAEAQMEWLSGLSHRLVDLVWMPPPQEDIDTAAAAASLSEVERKDSCFCGEEKPGHPLVQCCSNLCKVVWFHEGCAPMDTTTDENVTQDWYCSPACQGDGTYIYCYCKEQRGGEMVQCALMDQCRRHEWYHKDCLSPPEQGNADSEESPWYCSEMCFIASDADDHVLNYTKSLVWEGLYNLARRDAVREGDGEAMTDFWKMDMVLFWARNHLKDFTTCHRLLTGIEGFYSENIRQDLKWNRVVNLEGKPGCNISLDLVNEFMNVEFKESLGRVRDHYTNDMMKECGMIAGVLGGEPNRFLVTQGFLGPLPRNGGGLSTSLPSTHSYKIRRQVHIDKFVAEYKKDHLFRYIPGRAHQGFEKFTYERKIKTPKRMGNTMRKLAQDMDLQS